VVFVTSAYGLGETVVGGTVNPDEWRLGWQLVDGRQKSWILFNFDAI
jgi:phosphoenolpyruvate synthase/pyruvate phosphate dikinase